MAKRNTTTQYKPKRGLGQAVTRQRRKALDQIKREETKRIEERREAIRREINTARQIKSIEADRHQRKMMSTLLSSTMASQVAVMRSYGLTQSLDAMALPDRYTDGIMAYTDFQKIVIRWPYNTEDPLTITDTERIVDVIAQMKGVFQHELGHLRFTLPFRTLVDRTDHVREARGVNPPHNVLHRMWNVLEDQRMESAVVASVPRIAGYFTRMIAEHILGNEDGWDRSWFLLAGRQYLPVEVRAESRRRFTVRANDNGERADQWLTIVNAYKQADNLDDMMRSVIDACEFMNGEDIPETGSRHDGYWTEVSEDEAQEKASSGASTPVEEDLSSEQGDEGDESEGAGAGDSEGDESEGAGEGGQSSDAQPSSDNDGPAHGVTTAPTEATPEQAEDNFQKALEDALKQAEAQAQSDAENHEIARNATKTVGTDGLSDITHLGTDMPEEMVSSAISTSIGIERALSDFVTTSQPVWRNHQEEGAIDALSYRTKQVGERDFYRDLDGVANEGLDVHVSMLCDVSVSMGGQPMIALSEAVYSTAVACQNLGIGSSYTLWSDSGQTHRIWSEGNATPQVWPTLGGTDPSEALDDLDNHNEEGASNHLVLVFTDGEWSDGYDLQRWATPGRHIVLVRYVSGWMEHTDPYGADEVAVIRNVKQLPEELTNALRRVLNK